MYTSFKSWNSIPVSMYLVCLLIFDKSCCWQLMGLENFAFGSDTFYIMWISEYSELSSYGILHTLMIYLSNHCTLITWCLYDVNALSTLNLAIFFLLWMAVKEVPCFIMHTFCSKYCRWKSFHKKNANI